MDAVRHSVSAISGQNPHGSTSNPRIVSNGFAYFSDNWKFLLLAVSVLFRKIRHGEINQTFSPDSKSCCLKFLLGYDYSFRHDYLSELIVDFLIVFLLSFKKLKYTLLSHSKKTFKPLHVNRFEECSYFLKFLIFILLNHDSHIWNHTRRVNPNKDCRLRTNL